MQKTVLALAATLLACGAEGPMKLEGRRLPQRPSFTDAALALCQGLADCEPALGRLYVSPAACVDALASELGCDVEFHVSEAALAACEAAIDAAECDPIALEESFAVCAAARQVVEREAGLDEVCEAFDVACSEGLTCVEGAPGVCATCAPLPGAEQPCTPDDRCAEAAFCDGATCHAVGDDGSDCQDDLACLSGHCVAGECGALLTNGTPCFADDDCESGRCEAECLALLEAGESCSNDAQCASGWCEGDCREPIALGEACVLGERCQGALRFCRNGVCSELGAVGDECEGDVDCGYRGRCDDDSRCVAELSCAPAGLGEPCIEICVEGAYCNYDAPEPECDALTPAGSPCGSHSECGPDAFCDGDASPVPECAPRRGHGEPCDGDQACESTEDGVGDCDFGADPEPSCRLLLYEGEACGADEECLTGFCAPGDGRCADLLTCEMP